MATEDQEASPRRSQARIEDARADGYAGEQIGRTVGQTVSVIHFRSMSVSTLPALRASDCRSAWCQRGSRSCRWRSPSSLGAAIPRGVGNREITAVAPFQEAALGVAGSINRVAVEMGWHVERAAVDAPAAPPAASSRASENELGRLGLSSFRTPAASAWDGIKQKCVDHLGSGGSTATLPHANKIWMLFGFELFVPSSGSSGSRSSRYIRLLSSGHCYPPASTSRRSRGIGISSSRSPPAQGGDRRISKPNCGRRCREVVTIAWTHSWQLGLPPCRVQQRRAIGNAEQPDDAIWVPL